MVAGTFFLSFIACAVHTYHSKGRQTAFSRLHVTLLTFSQYVLNVSKFNNSE